MLSERFPGTRAVRADLLDPVSLAGAVEDIDVAYYLAHSMAAGETGFAERDLQAARDFATAAARAGVGRIIYLGGLGDDATDLSHHLASRHAVGAELAAHGVPVTEFRAAIVIGSGSASFEMLRQLTERLPLMISPAGSRPAASPSASVTCWTTCAGHSTGPRCRASWRSAVRIGRLGNGSGLRHDRPFDAAAGGAYGLRTLCRVGQWTG